MKRIILFLFVFLININCFGQNFFQRFGYSFQIDSSLLVKYKLKEVVLKDYKFSFLPNQKPTKELVAEKVIRIDSLDIPVADFAEKTNTVTLPKLLVPYYDDGRVWRVDYMNAGNNLTAFDLYVFDEYKLLNQLCHYELNSTGEIVLTEKIKIRFRK